MGCDGRATATTAPPLHSVPNYGLLVAISAGAPSVAAAAALDVSLVLSLAGLTAQPPSTDDARRGVVARLGGEGRAVLCGAVAIFNTSASAGAHGAVGVYVCMYRIPR